MLDYKSIIIKRYALKMSYKELAKEFSASKSGINDFIRWIFRSIGNQYPGWLGITYDRWQKHRREQKLRTSPETAPHLL